MRLSLFGLLILQVTRMNDETDLLEAASDFSGNEVGKPKKCDLKIAFELPKERRCP